MVPSRVEPPSHDLTAVVDAEGSLCGRSPGDVDGGEAAARIHEAMKRAASNETSHDLAVCC